MTFKIQLGQINKRARLNEREFSGLYPFKEKNVSLIQSVT